MSLLAGTAKRDITTNDAEVLVNDPLYAKALVLDDGSKTVVIIAMDVLAIGGLGDVKDDFLIKLRNRIEAELGIPGSHVLVNASHTHPLGRLLCNDEEQVHRTFDAVKEAMDNRVEARVGSGCGYEDRITFNRNMKMKDGSHWTVRYAFPSPPDEDVANVGPIDPDIGIIRIDRLDGTVLAVVYNFACHLLIGVPNKGVTANFPGFASKVIEESLGHGAMALFFQGAGGDILELYFKDVSRPRNSEQMGMMLGLSALKAIKGIRTAEVSLSVMSETVQLQRKSDFDDRIAARLRDQAELLASLRNTCLNFKTFLPLYLKYALNGEYPADYKYRYLQEERISSNELVTMDVHNRGNIDQYLKNIFVMEQLVKIQEDLDTLNFHKQLTEEAGEQTVAAEVQGIRIGECAIITAPAELLVEIGLNLKKASPHAHTIVSAFTNGYLHYAPPVYHYDKGGYEVTECMLGPEWQQVYEEKAFDILRKL